MNRCTIDKNDYTNQIEEIILNMKIIGSIQKKDKLSKNSDNILEIENCDIFQGLRRWYNNRNRNETLSHIRKIIQSCFDITDKTLKNESTDTKDSNRYFYEENSSLLQRFLVEMNSACKGLDNLKNTYKDDVKVVSEIECLKEQLQLRIKKINSLLKIDTNVINKN